MRNHHRVHGDHGGDGESAARGQRAVREGGHQPAASVHARGREQGFPEHYSSGGLMRLSAIMCGINSSVEPTRLSSLKSCQRLASVHLQVLRAVSTFYYLSVDISDSL